MEPMVRAVADCIRCIVTDNTTILEKLDDRFFLQIFKNMALYEDAGCLELLQGTLLLNGERHTKNSGLLMNRLSSNGELLKCWDGSEGRMKLMRAMLEYCQGNNKALDWHCAGLELMAVLCQGKAPDNEVKAQGLLSYFHVTERCVMFGATAPEIEGMPIPDQQKWNECVVKVKRCNLQF